MVNGSLPDIYPGIKRGKNLNEQVDVSLELKSEMVIA